MDLHNNAQGIIIGANNITNLPAACYDAVLDGRLRYLAPVLGPPFFPNGSPNPNGDPNFEYWHGIMPSTQIIPTNQ